MPKMKCHKGLAKRIRISAKGKVRHKPVGAGHLMSGKSGSRCRRLRKHKLLDKTLTQKFRALVEV